MGRRIGVFLEWYYRRNVIMKFLVTILLPVIVLIAIWDHNRQLQTESTIEEVPRPHWLEEED